MVIPLQHNNRYILTEDSWGVPVAANQTQYSLQVEGCYAGTQTHL
jgi:hypothetical protein